MATSYHQDSLSSSLELDAILSSTDPEVKRNMTQFLMEEMSLAQERALFRTAMKHISLLPPGMQQVLTLQAQTMQVSCHG